MHCKCLADEITPCASWYTQLYLFRRLWVTSNLSGLSPIYHDILSLLLASEVVIINFKQDAAFSVNVLMKGTAFVKFTECNMSIKVMMMMIMRRHIPLWQLLYQHISTLTFPKSKVLVLLPLFSHNTTAWPTWSCVFELVGSSNSRTA